jgi:predicted DNA-binding transcriptional regulator YafY
MGVDYILSASLEKHCTITIMYQKGDEITQREITVIKFKNGNIEAYCHLRHQIRNFKKGNILAAAFMLN